MVVLHADAGDVDLPRRMMEDLLQREYDGTLPDVRTFWSDEALAGHPGPWVLSHWWPAPVTVGGVPYRNGEAYLMAGKARLFGDDTALQRVLAAEHPAVAKKVGAEVRGFSEDLWQEYRFRIAVAGNLAKFTQHPELGAYLLSTSPRVLVEATPLDRRWGVGLAADDPRVAAPSEWRGENLLGLCLMHVRDLLAADP